jgi:hypothetical protein
MMLVTILAGVSTYIVVNALFGALYGFLCGSSRTMLALLRFSPFAFPIRFACWGVAAWAGWGVGTAVA